MPATKIREACISASVSSPNSMNSSISKKMPYNSPFPTSYGTREIDSILKKFVEECNNQGIPVNAEELDELATFLNFLTCHITSGEGYYVPCMLLWSEWAKFCLRQTRQYPGFIFEEEFRYLILQLFNLRLREDTSLGTIYPGLEFVPYKKAYV